MKFMKNRSFISQLIVLILVLIVGIPVIIGLSMFLIGGLMFLFGILVMAIGVTSAPVIAGSEPSVAMLIQGIPQNTIFFFGIGILSFTVFLFILYIFGVKHVILFLADMVQRILGVEVRHGKNS